MYPIGKKMKNHCHGLREFRTSSFRHSRKKDARITQLESRLFCSIRIFSGLIPCSHLLAEKPGGQAGAHQVGVRQGRLQR